MGPRSCPFRHIYIHQFFTPHCICFAACCLLCLLGKHKSTTRPTGGWGEWIRTAPTGSTLIQVLICILRFRAAPTPPPGSLEYGGPKPGQPLGGRWKPLHYWYRRSIFAPVMATCGLASSRPPHDHSPPLVQCYAKNDLPLPFDGEVRVDRVHLMSGTVTQVDRRQLTMAAGAGTSEWWTLNAAVNATVEVLKVTVVEAPITEAATPAGSSPATAGRWRSASRRRPSPPA